MSHANTEGKDATYVGIAKPSVISQTLILRLHATDDLEDSTQDVTFYGTDVELTVGQNLMLTFPGKQSYDILWTQVIS